MQRSTVVLDRRKKALRKTRIPSRLMFYYWKFKSSKNPCKKSCFLWAGGLELSTRTSGDKGKPWQVACISLSCVTCVRWVDLSEKAKSVYVDFGIEYIRQIFLFCYIKGMLCVWIYLTTMSTFKSWASFSSTMFVFLRSFRPPPPPAIIIFWSSPLQDREQERKKESRHFKCFQKRGWPHVECASSAY